MSSARDDERAPLMPAAGHTASAAASSPYLSARESESDDAAGGTALGSTPRVAGRVRVGLDSSVLDNQKKWKRLADIDDDNSTAKDMASEVQHEFMRHRQQLVQEQKHRLGSGIPTYHLDVQEDGDAAPANVGGTTPGKQHPHSFHNPLHLFRVHESGAHSSGHGSSDEAILSAAEYGSSLEEDKYLIAAAFIRDGVHGRKIGYRLDRTALFLNELFHSESYRVMYILVAAIMSLLAFVETPGNLNEYLTVDIVCLLIFGVDLFIRWFMSSAETQRKYVSRQPWAVVRTILLAVTCADLATNLLFPAANPYRYSRALRPFFFITRGRNIRIIFSSCLHALREVMIVLMLSFCLVAFFGLVGYLLFSDTSTDPSATFFNSVSSSMYTMLLIHNCMPYMAKSMYPYYTMTHWSAIFFVLFVLLTNLFLLKLTIAVSYKSYKKHTESMLYKRLQKRKAALYAAFDILAQDVEFGGGSIEMEDADDPAVLPRRPAPLLSAASRRGSSRYFPGSSDKRTSFGVSSSNLVAPIHKRQISLDTWICVCEYLKPKWTDTDATLVFNTVDIEHVGFLDLSDFYQLCSLLSVKLEHRSLISSSVMRWWCNARQRHQFRRFRAQVRNTLLYEVVVFGHYRVVLAELVVGVLICLSVVQAVQVNNIELAFSVNKSWRMLGFFLLILFTLEVALKMFAFGSSEFFHRPFCKLDLGIVTVGWVFYVFTTLDDPPSISLVLYDLALAIRSLRFLKLLNLFPPFHEILYTLKMIMPLIMQLLLVIFSVMYAFAIVTQANYGQALHDFPPSKQPESPSWYALRYEFQADTFEATLVTLFGLMNLAGWDMIMDAAHAMTGSDATYAFFFSYRITMSNLLLPIFVGFLVEAFVSSAKSVETTIQTYVEAGQRGPHKDVDDDASPFSGHHVEHDDEEFRMTLLESRQTRVEKGNGSGNGRYGAVTAGKEPPASPMSTSSADGDGNEVRIKYERRGSLVHNQMFDAVKLSDVSRLTLMVEKKDEEMAQQEATMRKLEGSVLAMRARVSQSQHKLLTYEAKIEELTTQLRLAHEQLEHAEHLQHQQRAKERWSLLQHSLRMGTADDHSGVQSNSSAPPGSVPDSNAAPKRERSSSWRMWN
jgi:hypothetical protein